MFTNDSNISSASSEGKPYFSALRVGDVFQTEGMQGCVLGQRIPRGGRTGDDGVFVTWCWDGSRLVVENDRYGLYPLFYCARSNSICISPSLAQVVRSNSRRNLDFSALSVFFRLGHFTGADTPFEDVRFLPPNSVLIWEDGRLDIQPRTDADDRIAPRSQTFDDAVENYRDLFARAVARRLPRDDRTVVPLSGGRDSRHILLELVKQGVRPAACATVRFRPPSSNEDMRVARLLTERLRIPHIEVDKPSSFFEAELKGELMANHCGGGHIWILPLAARLVGEFTTVYDGLAGEVLSAGFMLDDRKTELFRREAWEALARLILEEGKAGPVLDSVFSKGFGAQISLDAAVERLVPELKRHAGLPNPVLSFIFANRTRRCIASIPFAMLHQMPVVHVPYVDRELFEFLSGLDPAMMAGGRLHDETIRRAYPEYADIPYEDKSVKAVMLPADHAYYRSARRAFFSYLREAPAAATTLVKRSHLFARIGADLLRASSGAPWYMRPALQAIELEKLRLGC